MIKLSELSDDLIFFDDGDVFVVDRKSDKMFLVSKDIVGEITDRTTKLKILLESSVMDDSKARKRFALALSPTAIIEKAVEAVERARNAAKNNKDTSIQPIWDEMVKNELISEMILESLEEAGMIPQKKAKSEKEE